MATGGNTLARVFCMLLIVVPAAFVTPVAAQDSEAASKLDEGLKLLRAGDTDRAIQVLREAIAANPSSEEASAALGRAEWKALMDVQASGAKGANVAKAIMDLAMPVLPEKKFNEAELKKLVDQAVKAEGYTERFDAAISLARTYGEFAVPGLVNYLASSDTDEKIHAHVALQHRLGRAAVLPLNETVLGGNAQQKFMAAGELGVIGDERALAAVAEAMGDSDSNVSEQAGKAFSKLTAKHPEAAGMTASQLYLRLARLYYAGNYRVMGFADQPLVLWRWDGGLKHTAVPRHLYVLKLAEEACYDALRLDAENMDAASLLVRVLASEKMASDMMAKKGEDDEMNASYAAGLASAPGAMAAMGWNTLAKALGDSLDAGDQSAAVSILGVMPWVYGGADFSADNAVMRATSDSSAGVRMAACEAILRFNGTKAISGFADPDGFINLVGASVGEVIPRQILVIEADDGRRNKMLKALSDAKYVAYEARRGGEGVVRALRFIGLDLIVLSHNAGDMDALAVLKKLKDDDRTKDVPVVVVGTSSEAADDAWRGLYSDNAAGVAGMPEDVGGSTEEFLAAVKGGFGGDSPDAAARYARSASVLAALAHTDTGNALFNWNGLTETLTALINADVPNDPPVKLNALHALGNIKDASAMGALTAFFGSSDDAALQAAAGMAIASISREAPQTLDEAGFNALLKGTGSGDANVRKAAFAALGSCQLTASQMVAVATANRPGAKASE